MSGDAGRASGCRPVRQVAAAIVRALCLCVLLSPAVVAAAERVADILEDQRLHAYRSPTQAVERLRAAADVPGPGDPLEVRRRYHAQLGMLAEVADQPALVLDAVAELERMAEGDNCRRCRVDALLIRARGELGASRLVEAKRDIDLAQSLVRADEPALRLDLASIKARLHYAKGELTGAVEQAVLALELADELGSTAERVRMMTLLVATNADLGDTGRALEIADEAIELAESMGYADALGFLRLNQGHIHSLTGERDKQHHALLAALEVAGGDPDLARIEVITRSNLADYFLNQGDYDAALEHARVAGTLARSIDDRNGLVIALANQGIALSRIGYTGPGLAMLRDAIALAEELGHKGYIVGISRELVSVLESTGRYREALEAIHRVEAVKDELTRQEREKAVLEIQEKYASERKSREIERLSAENRLREAEVAARAWKQRLWAALAIAFALAAVLLVQWLTRSRRLARKLAVANASLAEESSHDPLTGAFNRRHFEHRMALLSAAGGGSAGLMVLDLDHFKRINDRHGHDAGDAVLVEVARRLRGLLRDQDAVVRWGGEEFVLVLPGTTPEGLPVLAARVLRTIGGEPVRSANRAITVTVSIGCVAQPVESDGAWRDGLRVADAAMYLAKQRGRNQAVCVEFAGADGPGRAVGGDLLEAGQAGLVQLSHVAGPPAARATEPA